MFPYLDTNHWRIGPYALNPYWALVTVAIAVGFRIASLQAERRGIPRERMAELTLWAAAAGLIGGHFAKFLYLPAPPHGWEWIDILHGQALFGSLIGAYLGALIFFWRHSIPNKSWYLYADASAFAYPCAAWIGRVGCYLVHDHPGIRATRQPWSLFAVRYPGGPRFDLGLLEVFFLLLLAAAFLLLDRKPRPPGFFAVAFALCYGLFRLLLDRLHLNPPRHFGWTVDQMFSAFLIATGVLWIVDLARLRRQSPS